MLLEKFRTFDGVMIQAVDNKALFKHCAGDDVVTSSKQKFIVDLLFMHGVISLKIQTHRNV